MYKKGSKITNRSSW